MLEQDKDGLAIVATLTDTVADSVNGYRDAAEHVESAEFRQMLTELGDQRSQVLSDLKAELARYGRHSSDRDGTIIGTIHQRWLEVKASIAGNDDKAVISEVERGEDYLKEKFDAVMTNDALEASWRAVIERAYASIRKGHDRVRDLKHALQGSTSH